MPPKQFDWNGNAGLGGSGVPQYRSPNNPSFSSVGGVAKWRIPLMGLPVLAVVGIGLLGFAHILFK